VPVHRYTMSKQSGRRRRRRRPYLQALLDDRQHLNGDDEVLGVRAAHASVRPQAGAYTRPHLSST
jgi:hypothetical protein